jgi:nucleoside-diphosphate-sugar epimerase
MSVKINSNILFKDTKDLSNKINLDNFKGKKILILGGNSFLTSYIQGVFFFFNKYTKKKCKVLSISKSKPRDHIKFFCKNDKNFTFIKLDLFKKKNISKIINKKYDYIFFAATYGQPKKWMTDQKSTIFLNTELLSLFLDKIKKTSTKLMFFSSIDIYGDTNNTIRNPINEDFNGSIKINSKRAVYGESKRLGEVICNYYRNFYKTKIYVVRPAHTYGPGMNYNDKRVIIDFIKKSQKGLINLLDFGKSIKTYGYIADIAEMFLNIMQYGKYHTYNTTGKDYSSILNLAKKIAKIKKVKVKLPKKISKNLIHINTDPANNIISSKKYINEFNKRTFVKFEDGIKKLIKYLNL